MGVFVVGMHRSGTSAVAAALVEVGLSAGSSGAMMKADAANPGGYFEIQEIADLNDRILEHLRGRWDAPPDLSVGWERNPSLDPWVQRARIARKEGLPAERWLLKDPRVTLLLPLWRRVVLDRCAAVLVVRDPTAVAWSVSLRDGLPMTTGYALWAEYNLAAIEGLAGLPVFVCDYDQLIVDPVGTLTDLVGSLAAWGEIDPDPEGLSRAIDSVRPQLNRSTWRRDAPETALGLGDIARISECLRDLAGRHDVFVAAAAPAAPWQRALLTERRCGIDEVRELEAVRASMARRIERLERELGESRAAYTAERTTRKETEGALRWTRARLQRLENRRSVRALRTIRGIGRPRAESGP